MNDYALIMIVVCCIAWMTRPGWRPHRFAFDVLPWLCVAGFVIFDNALGAACAWTAIPFTYFSIKYNQLGSMATLVPQGGLNVGSGAGQL